jgi:hypothetical protein
VDDGQPGYENAAGDSGTRIVSFKVMLLDLSPDEARDLGTALTEQLHILRAELSAADIRKFKHDLRERLDRLERIAARLEHEVAGDPAAAPG